MMSPEEYSKLLLKLVTDRYESYSVKINCRLLYISRERTSTTRAINVIESKIFYGLSGYNSDDRLSLPDGFFQIQDKFKNAQLLSLL